MPTIHIDLDPPGEMPVAFGGETASLAYFLSFAFAARYGAQHELTQVAQRLRGKAHGIDLKPLLTFADREADDPADERELQRVWQDAGPLAACCRRVVEAIDADEELRELLSDFPDLRDRIADLARIAGEAAERGARIRVTFTMD